MKKILIIGGAGFIGYPLTKKLISERYNVTIFDNLSNKSKNYSEDSLSIINGDITNKDEVTKCMQKILPDILIHLAACHYIPTCANDPIATQKINVYGTNNILDAIKDHSRKTHLIFTSSAAVYAPQPKAHKETSKTDPLEIYGKTKIEAENTIKKYASSYGIEYTIFRLFNVYGYGDNTPHLIPTVIDQVKNDSVIKLGNIESKRDYIYLEDVINGFTAAIKHIELCKNHTFNLGTGISNSAKEIVEEINDIMGLHLRIEVENKKLRVNDRHMLFSDNSKINNYLDWKPQFNLHEGLASLLKQERLI